MEQHYIGTAHAVLSHRPADLASSSLVRTGLLAPAARPARRRAAEAARGARFWELYAMLGLRTAVHADGTLEITVGATNTKGVMPCEESSSPSTTSTPT